MAIQVWPPIKDAPVEPTMEKVETPVGAPIVAPVAPVETPVTLPEIADAPIEDETEEEEVAMKPVSAYTGKVKRAYNKKK